jgi:hypothetical protein
MTYRAKFLIVLFLTFCTVQAMAQENLAVSTEHPVYSLIESAEVRGMAKKLSQVKPYTRRQIRNILAQIDSYRNFLSNNERKVLDFYMEEFSETVHPEQGLTDSLLNARFDFAGLKSTASIGIGIDAHVQMAAENIEETYVRAPVKIYARGDIYNAMFSYRMDVQFSFDRLRKYPWAVPGQWQPAGMGFHQSFSSSDAGDAVTGGVAIGYEMRPELTGAWWDDRIFLRYGILDNHRVGNGSQGLMISDTAVPYQAVELGVRFLPWFNFYFMTASLGDFNTDYKNRGKGTSGLNQNDFDNSNPGGYGPTRPDGEAWNSSYYDNWNKNGYIQNNKMLSYHTFEFFITDYFYFNVWESIIWGKRLELGYLNPLGFYMFQQNLLGDIDNMAAGISASTIAPGIGKFWFEFFADEIPTSRQLSNARLLTALQAGARFNIPWLPFAHLSLEYTKIEPFVFNHYYQTYNFNGQPNSSAAQYGSFYTDTSFTNEGKGLGTYLKPNSDEFKLTFETMPVEGLKLNLGWQLIRHGSNPKVLVNLWEDGWVRRADWTPDPNGSDADMKIVDTFWGWDPTKINGEYGATYPYADPGLTDKFKKFLSDGVYDWTNVFSVGASYDFRAQKIRQRKIPLTVSFEYQFAHTFFDLNGRDPNGYEDYSHRAGADPDQKEFFQTIIPKEYNNYEAFSKNIFILKVTVFPDY